MYACRKRYQCNFIKVNYFCSIPHQPHICQESLHHQSGKKMNEEKHCQRYSGPFKYYFAEIFFAEEKLTG